jgi:hypothetical protein
MVTVSQQDSVSKVVAVTTMVAPAVMVHDSLEP